MLLEIWRKLTTKALININLSLSLGKLTSTEQQQKSQDSRKPVGEGWGEGLAQGGVCHEFPF